MSLFSFIVCRCWCCVEGQEKGDWHDAEFGGGPKLVRLQGEVLNPVQVVQFACVAVADVLWLGLGVDYVHWLLQRQTLAQQAGDLSDANWNRRGDNRAGRRGGENEPKELSCFLSLSEHLF